MSSAALDTPGTVTVTGRGSSTTVPDSFTITLAIESSRPTVRQAYAQAAAALSAVTDKLRSLGVASEKMRSSALDVRADTRWQDGVGTVVSGYTVSSSLVIGLQYEQGAAEILAAVVDVGDNSVRLHGMTPMVADSAAAHDVARAAAWADARHCAEHFAELAGRQLGAVLDISEVPTGNSAPRPLMARAAMTMEAAPLPLEAGHNTLTVQLQATWQLL